MNVGSRVGEDLTKGFTDPGEAKRLKIVEFNEDSATLREFEVAEEDGLWTIPSKNGYPADAERQMAEAATSLMDRKILAIASENAGDHEQFGVIDPALAEARSRPEGRRHPRHDLRHPGQAAGRPDHRPRGEGRHQRSALRPRSESRRRLRRRDRSDASSRPTSTTGSRRTCSSSTPGTFSRCRSTTTRPSCSR